MKGSKNLILLSLLIIGIISCKANNPNIIILLADDLGYNDISCYRAMSNMQTERSPTCVTPNIDHLAKDGVLFTDFYAGAAVCSPSRAALLTGRNATRLGIYNYIPPESPMHLRDSEITIAEMVKKKGYQTVHLGKWHLVTDNSKSHLPSDQGFDYSFYTYNNAQPSHKNPVNYFRNGKPVGQTKGYACQLVVDEAINWLKDRHKSETPFYMNVWFNEPHDKVAAPDSLVKRHDYNAEYYGCIENMDNAIGRLLDYLNQTGLDKETVIIFSSDNGSKMNHSNDPLRGAKVFNYEGGLRVPFIIKWDKKIYPGKVSHFPACFTDVFLTLADIIGVPLKSNERKLDGISILPVIKGKKKEIKRNKPLFFFKYTHDPVSMLREGEWCLLGYLNDIPPYAPFYNKFETANIKPGKGEDRYSQWAFRLEHYNFMLENEPSHFALYNIKTDKEQRYNVADQYPGIVEKMRKEMLTLRIQMIEEGGSWFDKKLKNNETN
ncbi:sulfatase-like hydrolase/transferase [Maribellus maritimus]|uniref:sulfatase-like hydrolase/transferase n=1 Tax=Maribellus maritimus TaxID=2870838 RepID=UPI001EEA62BF|nr:sulfatase-like hydrolase/transferase [Maribellus maritimus]MCG6187640.1 sulfatase-like hydrolase/transferase [Maribellus maritimus]